MRATACLMLALALSAGCQQTPQGKGDVDVGGRVIDDAGEPLTPGYGLKFSREADDSRLSVLCRINESGRFACKCPAGAYRVTLLLPERDESRKAMPARQYWDLKVPGGGKTNYVLQTD